MRKKLLGFPALFVVAGLLLTSCGGDSPVAASPDVIRTVTGTAAQAGQNGSGENQPVHVTITRNMTRGIITVINVDLSYQTNGENADRNSANPAWAWERWAAWQTQAAAYFMTGNSRDLTGFIPVDGIASATRTFAGIFEATNDALGQLAVAPIPGPFLGTLSNAAGTAQGFGGAVTATVTTSNGNLTSAAFDLSNETAGFVQNLVPALAALDFNAINASRPWIFNDFAEFRTIVGGSTDVVAGATVSATAAFNAVRNALGY